jgi:hypothetical protein
MCAGLLLAGQSAHPPTVSRASSGRRSCRIPARAAAEAFDFSVLSAEEWDPR